MRAKRPDPLRVQTLFLHPFLGRRGTDDLYYEKLKELERVYPLTLHLCEAPLPIVLGNALHAADAIWDRFERRFNLSMPGWWSSLRRMVVFPKTGSYRSDVIFTNFLIPVNRVTIPMILEADFLIYGPPDEQDFVRRRLHVPAWFIRRVTLVVVRHELSRAAFAAKYPSDAKKAIVIPFYLPWVEPTPEENVIQKFRRFPNGEVQLLFVGNDARRKGLPSLLKGFCRLRDAGRRVHLTIVSQFSDGLVALPPEVSVFADLRPHDVYALMANAHIFAMPTRREAEGVVFWEAMANGCALLVPNTSPQREFFGEFAQCVPPDDVDAITAALGRFIDEVEFARSCALLGRQTFVERFHHSIVGKQYWELFQRAVDRRPEDWRGDKHYVATPRAL